MTDIPIHKFSDQFNGQMAKLKHLSAHEPEQQMSYAHRDDYFMFIFVEQGEAKILVDFEEHTIKEHSIYYILPEQIHLLTQHSHNASVWVLMVDSAVVTDEYREIFETNSPFKSSTKISKDVKISTKMSEDIKSSTKISKDAINEIEQLLLMLNRRLNSDNQPTGQNTVYHLIAAYIGMVAELHDKDAASESNKRAAIITYKFKSLLAANFQSMKKPSQYADALHLSANYLNEAVKQSTGFSVSECIRQEVIIRAKRLLFHTKLSIKEIAWKLGYEDWAYFSRIFSKSTNTSPTQFRERYLK